MPKDKQDSLFHEGDCYSAITMYMYTRKVKACRLLSCRLKLRFDYSSDEDGQKLAAIICFSVQLPRKVYSLHSKISFSRYVLLFY